MSNSTRIEKFECASLADLLDAAAKIIAASGQHPSTIYLHNREQDALRIELMQNTLTDGSHTYDAVVTPLA
jgi:hypothetical protein